MPLFAELQKLLSWSGGPVNWDLAKQVAVSTLAGSGSSSVVSPADRMAVPEAIRLADLWLDDATDFPSGVTLDRVVDAHPVAGPHAAGVVGAVRAGGRPGGRGHVQRDPRGAAQGARWRQPAGRDDAAGRRADVRRAGRAGTRRPVAGGSVGHRHRHPDRAGRGGRAAAAEPRRIRAGPRTARPRRCGSTSRCARPRTSGCSRTSRGCASTCSTPSTPTRAASTWTCPRSSRRWAASTPPTRRASRTRCPAGCSRRSRRPSSRTRCAGWRPCSR